MFDDDDDDDLNDDDLPDFSQDELVRELRLQCDKDRPRWKKLSKQVVKRTKSFMFPSDKLGFVISAAHAVGRDADGFKAVEPVLVDLCNDLVEPDQRMTAALCLNHYSMDTHNGYKALSTIEEALPDCKKSKSKIDGLAALLNDDRPVHTDLNDHLQLHKDYFRQWRELFDKTDVEDRSDKLCDMMRKNLCYNVFKPDLLRLAHSHLTSSLDDKAIEDYTDNLDLILILNRAKIVDDDPQDMDDSDETFPDVSAYNWPGLFFQTAVKHTARSKKGLSHTINALASLYGDEHYHAWVDDSYRMLDSLSDYVVGDKPVTPVDRSALVDFPTPSPTMVSEPEPFYVWAEMLHDQVVNSDAATQKDHLRHLMSAYGWIKEQADAAVVPNPVDTSGAPLPEMDRLIAINEFKGNFLYIAAYGIDNALRDDEEGVIDKRYEDEPADIYEAGYVSGFVGRERRTLNTLNEFLTYQKWMFDYEAKINESLFMMNSIDRPLSVGQFNTLRVHVAAEMLDEAEADARIEQVKSYFSPN